MREIDVRQVKEAVKTACADMAVNCSEDILAKLKERKEAERGERSRMAMEMLIQNAEIAKEEGIPLCQDTGLVTVYLHIGQEIHFTGGNLYASIQEGISESYTENFLRASAVSDPLFDRINTKDNTPGIVYCEITEGSSFRMEISAKGFGSENMSRIKMLKPAEGIQGVKDFVIETIRLAGANACPPMIVGVGIGGTFDYSAVLAKQALLRPMEEGNGDERYRQLEKVLEEEANTLMIGPMGLHGLTTVLKVSILSAPTHIAGLPCAVNICCHACRHREIVL